MEPFTVNAAEAKETGIHSESSLPDQSAAEEEKEEPEQAEEESVKAGESSGTEGKVVEEKGYVQEKEVSVKGSISFGEDKNIVICLVNDMNGIYYYTGSTVKPDLYVYYDQKTTDDGIDPADIMDEATAQKTEVKVGEKKYVKKADGQIYERIRLVKEKDYTIDTSKAGKTPGTYKLTVKAVGASDYTGSKEVTYKIIEKNHIWGSWKTTIQQTAVKTGLKQRTCSVCGKVEKSTIAKLKPTAKVNMSTIRLRVRQTTTKFKVSGLAPGDSVKSYKSSNKKIFSVNSKGKLRAKRKGSAKLIVTLKSGKRIKVKVKVQRSTVKTTKISVNTSKVTLLKGGKYTLKTTKAPLTTQQKTTYKSSNRKVATVSSKGVITAKKKGTATITIRSGSKKKTCKVTVETRTFPKGDTTAFLRSCGKIANIIMTDGDWIYYSGPGMKKSLAEVRAYNPRRTSCANFVNLCMQEFGTLEPGMAFYSDGNGKLVYQGSSSLKKETKKLVEANYDIINIGGKKAVKAGLQPGDICLYKGHTNVFIGLDSEGVPTWYDAGRNSTSDGKPGSVFTHMYRTSHLNSLPVYMVLRLKKK